MKVDCLYICSRLGLCNTHEITRVGKRDSHTATGLTHSQHSEHNAHSDRIDTQSIHNHSNFAHSDRIDTQSIHNNSNFAHSDRIDTQSTPPPYNLVLSLYIAIYRIYSNYPKVSVQPGVTSPPPNLQTSSTGILSSADAQTISLGVLSIASATLASRPAAAQLLIGHL